mgnify:FL=1
MASKIDDIERDRRIDLIGDFFIQEKTSVRKTTKFFSDNFFPISSATVYDYLKRYMNKYPEKKNLVLEILSNNKGDSIEDESIRNRVMNNLKYALSGYTVEEISSLSNISYWTVYRDLSDRLSKIDMKLSNEVIIVLNKRKRNNLKNGR